MAHGVRIEFHLPEALLAKLPSPIIPGGERPGGERDADSGLVDAVLSAHCSGFAGDEAIYEISENGDVLGTATGLRAAADAIESRAQEIVAELASGVIFVHAGVVAFRDRAIVLPGLSFSGKSTLVLALVEAGATYYSDEYAIFDAQGLVHPFRRFPKLRLVSGGQLENHRPTGVVRGPAPKPIPVGLVLMTRYSNESDWAPRRLSDGETLLGLLGNTVAVRNQPETSIRVLKKAIACTRGFESPRGEAAEAAQRVLALL